MRNLINLRFISCKILCFLLLTVQALVAQDAQPFESFTEGEIVIGPSFSSVGSGEAAVSYWGLTLGGSFNAHLLDVGIGTLGVAFPFTLTFGERSDADGIDYQKFQMPAGLMLSIGDREALYTKGTVAAMITMGMCATIGAFSNPNKADIRPFINFDLAAGVFERGMLKIRYSTSLGSYQLADGREVSHHGIYFVGSTLW